MGALTSVGPQLLVVALLAIASIITAAIAPIITAVMRFKMLDRALEGTKPKERPGIIRELRGLWSDWQLVPLRRLKPSKPPDDADDGSEPPTVDR